MQSVNTASNIVVNLSIWARGINRKFYGVCARASICSKKKNHDELIHIEHLKGSCDVTHQALFATAENGDL